MAEDYPEKEFRVSLPTVSTNVSTKKWRAGQPIERIHRPQYSALQFNPGTHSGRGARFSPFKDSTGKNVPTLYGGESSAVALMETLFHDLPIGCMGLNFDMGKPGNHVRSKLIPSIDLALVNITPMTMRRWGITQAELLGSDMTEYPITQKWAERIHHDNPLAKGIQWPSKQHGGKAVMLFGDRIKDSDLEVMIESEAVTESDEVLYALYDLADELDLVLLPQGLE
ncbi:RES family NAD+ phosphorylase [Phytobacter sp. V91]|uniref:RES family NAD+ phosphorylase n=1 Tax=Phytobacter sp. V91 TaxID=3369425 RepID=UPI003F63705F